MKGTNTQDDDYPRPFKKRPPGRPPGSVSKTSNTAMTDDELRERIALEVGRSVGEGDPVGRFGGRVKRED